MTESKKTAVALSNEKPVIRITLEMMDAAADALEDRGIIPYGAIGNPIGAGFVLLAALKAGGFDVRVPENFPIDS